MIILGISAFFHDSSACLIKDGIIVAAAEEERFTRKKHDLGFPFKAIEYCLKECNATINDVNYIAYYEKPILKFERILKQFLESFPWGYIAFYKTIPSWVNEKLRIRHIIKRKLKFKGNVFFIDHHLAHAASSYLMSPFDEAAILIIDGVGEMATTSLGYAKGNEITLNKQINFPHSLGLLYSTVTAFLGYKVNDHEYRVMGLAAYGKPVYYDKLKKLIEIREDGSYKLNMDYFAYHYKMSMPSKKFIDEFGPIRRKDEEITQRHKNMAASLQKLTEELLFLMANNLHKTTGMKNLCLAGGVALNSVANGKIIRNTKFENIYIQPAAGDGGTSIGAAAYAYYSILKHNRRFVLDSAYLGPGYSNVEIKEFLEKNGINYSYVDTEKDLIKRAAEMIDESNVIGWFQGRMEFGPRALGNRSILSNPCNPRMQDILNIKVKHRECYDNKTQILTKEGWKLFNELNGKEKVATLNPKNNELVYQKIKRRIEYQYSGKMIHFKNKRIDLLVTPEHKIWAKIIKNHTKGSSFTRKFEFKNALNLLGKEHVQIKGIKKWAGKEKKYFMLPMIDVKKFSHLSQTIKIPMDLWLEFLGYYLSEGCCTYNQGHHCIYIAQSKKSKHYRKIKECLNKLYKWNYNNKSFRVSNKQLFEYLKKFGKAKDKFIPRKLMNLPEMQLKILFYSLMRGDGTYRPKQYKYTTTSKRLADDVQELGIKLGYSVTTSKEKSTNKDHNDVYYVRLNNNSKISWIRKNQSNLTNYKGNVYCVTVPKYHILCIKRGEKIVFSGNSFRPFAPVVCIDDANDYFECDKKMQSPSDFMLMVYPIRKSKQKLMPAVVHVDGSGRLQTIKREQNHRYYDLIKEFGKLSKLPILINTSFNIRGEPIVCTPHDAYKCMMGTGIDYLVMENFIIARKDNMKDAWNSEESIND